MSHLTSALSKIARRGWSHTTTVRGPNPEATAVGFAYRSDGRDLASEIASLRKVFEIEKVVPAA